MKRNFMENLLDGVTVEYKNLVEITKVLRGKRLTRDKLSGDERFPVFHGGLDPLGYYGLSNRPANSVMIINVGASAGTVGYSDVEFWSSDGCYCIQHSDLLDNKFLYYFLIGQQHLLRSKVRFAGIPTLDANVIEKIKIPIPCPDNPEKSLEIQAEIVRILDTFTELTAELTAELAARKKQYTYYRDKLLTFEEGEVEWKPLGDIARIQRGASPRPINNFITDEEDGIPWIKIGDTIPNSKYVSQTKQKITLEGAKKSRILKKGDFIMSNSMSFGRPYILNIEGAIHDGWASISDYENKLNSDFLYHFLSSDLVLNYWNSKINSGSVSNLNADIIKSLEIPIPTLSEQERIARVLDNFDTLTSSITEGLPREIELRQKQYEYYRNMLLSFPKEEV